MGQGRAQNQGGGGGGGSGTVTSIATACGVTGGTITATGSIAGAAQLSANAGLTTSTVTLAATDCGRVLNSAYTSGTQAFSLVNANFAAGNYFDLVVLATAGGAVTLTPTSGTIDGAASEAFQPGQSTTVFFDGTNWWSTGTWPLKAENYPGFVSNTWYNLGFPNSAPATGSAQTANVVYCTAYTVPVNLTVKALGVNVSSGNTSNHISFAIYNASAGRPTTLVDYVAPSRASRVRIEQRLSG